MNTTQVRDEREELRERIASWTNAPLNVLSIVLLVVIITEFSTNLSPEWESRLALLNWFIYVVFASDFAVQLFLAPDRQAFLRRNWLGVISLASPAFRVLRVLRAVRLLRGVRLVRALTATNRGTRALNRMLRGHQFGRVVALTLMVVAVGAAALVYFEAEGARFGTQYGTALWHAASLVTTVGSEFQPATLEGRLITIMLIVWGLGVFGYITGAIASYFVGQDNTDRTHEEVVRLRQDVAELRMLLSSLGPLQEGLSTRPGKQAES